MGRKALSPIFASLLILGVVTVLFMPVFLWATGYTAESKSFWDLSGTAATERVVIEIVDLNQTDSSIYVRNIGKTAVKITNVIVITDSSTHLLDRANFETFLWEAGAWIPHTSPSLGLGDLIKIYVDFQAELGSPLPDSDVYTVKVITERGAADTYHIAG